LICWYNGLNDGELSTVASGCSAALSERVEVFKSDPSGCGHV